jgi:hypothetical protein
MKASNGGKMDFVAGDLIEFGWIYSTCSLNNKTALYLGECFIYRPDGVVIIAYHPEGGTLRMITTEGLERWCVISYCEVLG